MSTEEKPAGAQATAERTDRETTYHPALSAPATRGIAAGKVLVIVLVALVVAGLLNSAWMVRTAEGMKPGLGKTIASGVAAPFDFVASHLSLDRPRQGVDLLLGREPAVQAPVDIEDDTVPVATEDSAQLAKPGSTAAPVQVSRTAPRTVPHPTAAKPLKVLVLGDSLSTYTGQRLTELMAKKGLAGAQVEFRNGVGLATPQFFNWPNWAIGQIDKVKPDAVVVILGGNDNLDMQRKDTYFNAGTPEWQAEYQRRVEVVLRAMVNHGVDRVYWSGPPTARSPKDNELYHKVNMAAAAAAKAVPGARFVDIAGPTSDKGQWTDTLVFGNDAFAARMGDGFHWSWKAAQITSHLIANVLAKDYGPLY